MVVKIERFKYPNNIAFIMVSIDKVVLKAVKNLKQRGKLNNVKLSTSYRSDSGIDLSQVNESELKDYLSKITNLVYLHGVEPAKESWHQINGLFKPMVNAGIIELGKILPYMPGIDKNHLYRAIGIKIGKNTTIAPRVQFDYFHPELIEIGDNCLIGDGVKIWAHDYGIGYFMMGPVKIGNNVKIGSESIIGPSRIGNNVKINFGAFVYGNIPDNAKVKGRERSRYEK